MSPGRLSLSIEHLVLMYMQANTTVNSIGSGGRGVVLFSLTPSQTTETSDFAVLQQTFTIRSCQLNLTNTCLMISYSTLRNNVRPSTHGSDMARCRFEII